MRQSSIDNPATLVIEDICSDFAESLRIRITVQEVVLDLKVLSHRYQNVLCCLVSSIVLDARHLHRQRDWKVKGIERCLVDNDKGVSVRIAR